METRFSIFSFCFAFLHFNTQMHFFLFALEKRRKVVHEHNATFMCNYGGKWKLYNGNSFDGLDKEDIALTNMIDTSTLFCLKQGCSIGKSWFFPRNSWLFLNIEISRKNSITITTTTTIWNENISRDSLFRLFHSQLHPQHIEWKFLMKDLSETLRV